MDSYFWMQFLFFIAIFCSIIAYVIWVSENMYRKKPKIIKLCSKHVTEARKKKQFAFVVPGTECEKCGRKGK